MFHFGPKTGNHKHPKILMKSYTGVETVFDKDLNFIELV